jgi:hypothetical protein
LSNHWYDHSNIYKNHAKWIAKGGWEKKKNSNPGFEKYFVPLQYTQSTCGAALEDDFSSNKRCFVK